MGDLIACGACGNGVSTHGVLQSDAGHLYRFIAAGNSGDLVAQSYGRLCGMVTGNYEYSNSGGGNGHAVAIVGMFDLPQNKAAPCAKAGPSAQDDLRV